MISQQPVRANVATMGLSQCPALVLVGGLGTRLRRAYADGPKTLAPVAGKAFLAYLLKLLADNGLLRVVLCSGYRAEQIERWLADAGNFNLDIHCSHEDEPLGNAGALGLAYTRYAHGERVFAMNGDSILRLPLGSMWNAHIACAAEATVALARVPDTSRYGSVEVNEGSWVTSFREKAGATPGFINGGVYLFEPSLMDRVVRDGYRSLEREVLPAQIARGLLAFKSDGYFIDIGVPQDLARAQSELGAVVSL